MRRKEVRTDVLIEFDAEFEAQFIKLLSRITVAISQHELTNIRSAV